MTDIDPHPPITVLEVTTPPDGTTRYIDQIVTTAHPALTFRYFSWKRALTSRYDVLHVHWPENLVRHRSRLRKFALPLLLIVLITTLRLRGIPIVRTLHNINPHERGTGLERFALKTLDRATTVFVTINPVTRPPHGIEVSIPHGHYRTRFTNHVKNPVAPRTIAYAGLIRPYKGVERLIEAFARLPDGLVDQLRIVGNPTPNLRAHITDRCSRDSRITARLEFVSDAELVLELSKAELICLPYDEMHNSGMALVGLSLDRPILVPDTDTTRALSEEVGAGWIYRFRSPFDADQLEAALRAARADSAIRSVRPTLEDRDWELVSERYEQAFRLAIRTGKKKA